MAERILITSKLIVAEFNHVIVYPILVWTGTGHCYIRSTRCVQFIVGSFMVYILSLVMFIAVYYGNYHWQ